MLVRIAMGLEYHGRNYCGWQKQGNALSVQAVLELALSKVANHVVVVFCAGRTDKGVHAVGQVVHFDAQVARSEVNWLCGTNANLPLDIRVTWVKSVPMSFHARYSAVSRVYQYVMYTQAISSAIVNNHAVWVSGQLDIDKMQAAANYWVGEHDFSAFRSSGCQSNSPVRCVQQIKVWQTHQFVVCQFTANAFLHHMIRNFMGVLMPIGLGKQEVVWAKTLLLSKNRCLAGVTSPAHGLYLCR